MNDQLAFKRFMDIVLAEPGGPVEYPAPNSAAIADALLGTSRVIVVQGRRHSKSIAQMVIDLQRELEALRLVPKPVFKQAGKFTDWIIGEEQQEPEPRAKNGALANRKTEAAKAKLPFYHKNRRF